MKIRLFFIIVTLIYSCKGYIKVDNDTCKTINIKYSYSSSLDNTNLKYSGTLNYIFDSTIKYNIIVNDSFLFYNYNNRHGALNMITHIIDEKNPIDEAGIPEGTFASGLFPLFIGDSTYINDIRKDTIENTLTAKTIGNVILIERYTNKSYDIDEMIKFVNSRDYICFNKLSNQVYFESYISNFSISGLAFTQKEFKSYSYPKSQNCSLNSYDSLINKTIELKHTKAVTDLSQTLSTIPNFKYYDLKNKYYDSKNIIEDFTLLEFWYASCAPCLKNMQNLSQLYSSYKNNKKIKFLILNDADLNLEKIKSIKQKYNLNYELYYKGDSLKQILNIQAHPCTIIYNNRNHKIIYKKTGANSNYATDVGLVLDSILQ